MTTTKDIQGQYYNAPWLRDNLFKITPLTTPATITIKGNFNQTNADYDRHFEIAYSYNGYEWINLERNSSNVISFQITDAIYLKSNCYQINKRTGKKGPIGFGWFYAKLQGGYSMVYFMLDCSERYVVSGKLVQLAETCMYLFTKSTNLIDASSLSFDGYEGMYKWMFNSCSNLVYSPQKIELPYLGEWTYISDENIEGICRYMFNNCTSLQTVPQLPTTYNFTYTGSDDDGNIGSYNCLTPAVYMGMFAGCTSLTEIPQLPANICCDVAYNSMFARSNVLFNTTQTETCNHIYRIPTSGTFKAIGVTEEIEGSDPLYHMMPKENGTNTNPPSETYFYINVNKK